MSVVEKMLKRYLPQDNVYLLLAVAITILATGFYLTDIIGIKVLFFYLSYPVLAVFCYIAVKRNSPFYKRPHREG
ncbi:hypothetical protein VLB34_003708 [Salmonella enterica]|nr:hypothetical protein [Salmonella enterica]